MGGSNNGGLNVVNDARCVLVGVRGSMFSVRMMGGDREVVPASGFGW